jgi:hypothetical protein
MGLPRAPSNRDSLPEPVTRGKIAALAHGDCPHQGESLSGPRLPAGCVEGGVGNGAASGGAGGEHRDSGRGDPGCGDPGCGDRASPGRVVPEDESVIGLVVVIGVVVGWWAVWVSG